MKVHVNRVIVAIGLIVVLPLVAVIERVRPGAGRTFAVRSVRRLARLCGVRFDVVGADQLVPWASYVFVANHSSPADIAVVLAAHPDVRFLAAAELFKVPLLGSAMHALGTEAIDRKDRVRAREQLDGIVGRGGRLNLFVFPEGGIVPIGGRRRFKSGAFRLAISAGATVVPVSIENAAAVLPQRARLGVRSGTIRIRFLEPIATDDAHTRDAGRVRDVAEQAVRSSLRPPQPTLGHPT